MAGTLRIVGVAAALAIFERLLPAVAAGLVTLAHELHAPSAAAEAARRAEA